MMQIFISWSGSKSKQIAEAFNEWIPIVIQSVTTYFSPTDIDKGTRWSTEISKKLSEIDIGIICLTEENLKSEWILFEAGALSKVIDQSNVCPILFGINNIDVSGPLKQFQSTNFNKEDFFKLIKVINSKLGISKLSEKILQDSFNTRWDDFEKKINAYLEADKNKKEKKPIRNERDILEEILTLSREGHGILYQLKKSYSSNIEKIINHDKDNARDDLDTDTFENILARARDSARIEEIKVRKDHDKDNARDDLDTDTFEDILARARARARDSARIEEIKVRKDHDKDNARDDLDTDIFEAILARARARARLRARLRARDDLD